MQPYINQLIEDIEKTILYRWSKHIPHFYGIDVANPYLKKPKGLKDYLDKNLEIVESTISRKSKEMMEELEFEKTIEEVEEYIKGDSPHNMYYHFGFYAEQFPPLKKLNNKQLNDLTYSIIRLWTCFNYGAVFPLEIPSKILYPLFIKEMHKPKMLMNHGHMGIEFCDYNPKNCPFGEYCDCSDL